MLSRPRNSFRCRFVIAAFLFVAILSTSINCATRAACVALPAIPNNNANASADSATQLQAAVHRMTQWLGADEKAQGWRRFLLLNVLDAQTAKGVQADLPVLQELIQRFSADVDGLDHPAFNDVRMALEHHFNHLASIAYPEMSDLQNATRNAIGDYSRISLDEVDYRRRLAIYELKLLKKYYRHIYPSRYRSRIFLDLDLDATIEYLEEVKIEMPPEYSVGKIRSLLNDQQKMLREVQDKIDALPVSESAEDDAPAPDAPVIPQEEVVPPQPDSSDDSLDSLKKQKARLNERINELKSRGREILKVDRPRLERRADQVRKLRDFFGNFEDVGHDRQLDPYFVSAANALSDFYFGYRYCTEDNIQEDFLKQVLELSKLLPTLDDPVAQRSHAKVGQILEWLERRQQLPELTSAIRARYSNPNMYFQISSDLIYNLGGQSQQASRAVAEDFFGRFIRGMATTNANISVELQPDPNQVHASIHLQGNVQSSSYARIRSLRANASSYGDLEGRRSIYANVTGMVAGESQVAADLDSQFGGVTGKGSQFNLVQKIARKSFLKEKARNDAEASRRAEKELFEQFDSETSAIIDDGIEQIGEGVARAQAVSKFLPETYLRSFYDRIELVGIKSTISTLAAPSAPLEHFSGRDVQLKIHESMIGNYLDQIFAGKEFTQTELAEDALDLTGEVPEFLLPKDNPNTGEPLEDFVITFTKVRPIEVTFDNNRLGVTIRGAKFAQGDQEIAAELVIKLEMRVVQADGKLLLEQTGKPTIKIADDQKPSPEGVALLALLEKQIEADKTTPREGAIELPKNFVPDLDVEEYPNAKFLKSVELGLFKIEKGWLYLGWNYQPGAVETPAIWREEVITEMEGTYTPMDFPAESSPANSTAIPVEFNLDVPASVLDTNGN